MQPNEHAQDGLAVQLKVAEQAVQAYAKVASDAKTTRIVPSNMTEVSGLIASACKWSTPVSNGDPS